MSPPSEDYLADYICSNCHAGILQEHPEEKFAREGYKKCPICGFGKKFEINISDVNKIIFGKKYE